MDFKIDLYWSKLWGAPPSFREVAKELQEINIQQDITNNEDLYLVLAHISLCDKIKNVNFLGTIADDIKSKLIELQEKNIKFNFAQKDEDDLIKEITSIDDNNLNQGNDDEPNIIGQDNDVCSYDMNRVNHFVCVSSKIYAPINHV